MPDLDSANRITRLAPKGRAAEQSALSCPGAEARPTFELSFESNCSLSILAEGAAAWKQRTTTTRTALPKEKV